MNSKGLFVLLFFLSITVFSQKSLDDLRNKTDSICNKVQIKSFCKVLEFYKLKQYDSCYVYSNKALLDVSTTDQKDIIYYIESISPTEKGFFKKALISLHKISDTGRFTSLKNLRLGYIYLNQQKYDQSILSLEKCLSSKDIMKDIEQKSVIYHNLAGSYSSKKDFKKADFYYKKQLSLIQKNDTNSLIKLKLGMAYMYYDQFLDKQAIPLFKESYSLAQLHTDIDLKESTAFSMAVVEENRKRYKKSIAYYKQSNRWKDSIWNRDKIWEITERDKKNAVANKQQEIGIKNEEIKRQKIVQKGLIFGGSLLLFLLGVLGFVYKKLRSKNKLIIAQKEALSVANKTKDYLFSVVSHDLRSPINTIKRQHKKLEKHIENNDLPAISEATKVAISVTQSTSRLLDNVLYWSLDQSNMLSFTPEKNALRPIIEHLLFDYENLGSVKDISISSDLETGVFVLIDKESLKIVLRNLIDNSMKYMKDSGSISIKMKIYSKNQASIEIKDTGIGISPEKIKEINGLKDVSVTKIDHSKGVGLGLLLCQTLVKKNNGTLFFESELGRYTTAVILVPLV
ncbi:tetratricopeptide repeat-containing sensor histidine kinase [Tenacibaculum finnmarkense]|uniref:tetratricopeptide repeat-containing sensor histidine kinase n=1 Tax=Tenacibaculum finnmarkense TaxID=2781243 RepID=UPI001EFC0063|nr:ATP-binding protein [Tenacibaculum finnmarkense]MCG8730060.1 GHKL domain-containing protein [Tenacibaculum finnmarkense]MCG8771575.1 GHKL domain-containing protein [Tenacibaculum finnmarkense]MCG8834444.1 GHKL domain-containing protein [Tenacibaculum finnmarkense]MCG8893646.1 GHKL domain-containing protein [Tenacibaculum finnmarkense]MCG8901723.1 GHKL domain-containing protein [Tenacibaculum finnmarkense]